MNEILGQAKTIQQLLHNTKYSIDYYQREYKWESKQIQELIEDLSSKFLDDHDATDGREQVESYGHYFLGSIIISRKDGVNYLVDGQQRLTSLTLLLIFLNHLKKGSKDCKNISDLIYSEKYGTKSFNIQVEDRIPCMEALFDGQPFDPTDLGESVQNIVARYADIESQFPADLKGESLPFFIDWLIENVHLVEITAYSDEDAYTIFETMNDRGLSLKPADMLKGFLLANITDSKKRFSGAQLWKERTVELNDGYGKDTDAEFLKNWLRSQYAGTIRERKKGAKPGDYDRIGTEFHRWVREFRDQIGLGKSEDFSGFLATNFKFYAAQHLRVLQAGHDLKPGLEHILYVGETGFTHHYQLLLAPLEPSDSEPVIIRKLQLVARFVDILLARRMWNLKSIGYKHMQFDMFKVMIAIRRKSVDDLAAALRQHLDKDEFSFQTNDRYYLHQQNRYQIHWLLARMIDYIEAESGAAPHFREYLGGDKKVVYEVEHIWADKFERHTDEFNNEHDFREARDRIGGLLLLPKKFNASYGALEYLNKLDHYNSQNVLARSLHPKCYEHNPGFLQFVSRAGLPFRPHETFQKVDQEARLDLYKKLAERIWDPGQIGVEAK